MDLLLIRHAKAEPYASSDAARELTEKGRGQAEKVGQFLKQHDLVPEVTLASPLARARQTAEICCAAAGAGSPVIEPWLACGMRPSSAMKELTAYSRFQRVAIVGHNPDFECLAEWLLASQAGGVHVRKASVIHFSQLRPPSQGGYLEMMVPCSAI